MKKSVYHFFLIAFSTCSLSACYVPPQLDYNAICATEDPICLAKDNDGDGVKNGDDDFPFDRRCDHLDNENCTRCGVGCESPLVCIKTQRQCGMLEVDQEVDRGAGQVDQVDQEVDRGAGQVDQEVDRGAGQIDQEMDRGAGQADQEVDRGAGQVDQEVDRGGEESDQCIMDGLDNNCDGLDNDCDGQVDEEYLSQPTSCTPTQTETRLCGESNIGICMFGMQTRVCGEHCEWEPFGECIGALYPQQEICGNQEDEDCDGMVERAPDIYESNNSCVTCADIPGVNPEHYTLRATIDSVDDDWDYYCFEIEDGFNPFPLVASNIQVELRDVPVGRDYDLYLYQSVTDCEQNNSLARSTEGAGETEELEWDENTAFGADDSGRYVIGVRNFNRSFSCENSYELYVHSSF